MSNQNCFRSNLIEKGTTLWPERFIYVVGRSNHAPLYYHDHWFREILDHCNAIFICKLFNEPKTCIMWAYSEPGLPKPTISEIFDYAFKHLCAFEVSVHRSVWWRCNAWILTFSTLSPTLQLLQRKHCFLKLLQAHEVYTYRLSVTAVDDSWN